MTSRSQRWHWIVSHTADVMLLILIIGAIIVLLTSIAAG